MTPDDKKLADAIRELANTPREVENARKDHSGWSEHELEQLDE